jgi:hypothetical protein
MYQTQPFNGNCEEVAVRFLVGTANHHTIPLLPASTSTSTTELLGLHPSGISNEETTVICHEFLFQLQRAVSILVFRIVCNKSLCDGLANSIHLRRVSTTFHAHTDIEDSERIFPSN